MGCVQSGLWDQPRVFRRDIFLYPPGGPDGVVGHGEEHLSQVVRRERLAAADGPAYDGNSGFVVLDIIYLQFRFGVPDQQLFAWLVNHEKTRHTEGYFQLPIVLGEILSRDCPVQVADWGRAAIESAEYDPVKKQARVRLENPTAADQEIIFMCRCAPVKMSVDQKTITPKITKDRWGTGLLRLDLAPGKHLIVFSF